MAAFAKGQSSRVRVVASDALGADFSAVISKKEVVSFSVTSCGRANRTRRTARRASRRGDSTARTDSATTGGGGSSTSVVKMSTCGVTVISGWAIRARGGRRPTLAPLSWRAGGARPARSFCALQIKRGKNQNSENLQYHRRHCSTCLFRVCFVHGKIASTCVAACKRGRIVIRIYPVTLCGILAKCRLCVRITYTDRVTRGHFY